MINKKLWLNQIRGHSKLEVKIDLIEDRRAEEHIKLEEEWEDGVEIMSKK